MIPADVRLVSAQGPLRHPGEPHRRVDAGREVRRHRVGGADLRRWSSRTSASSAPASRAARRRRSSSRPASAPTSARSPASIVSQQVQTAFDKGVSQFTWLMIRFIAVMVPLVFVINGLTKGDWKEAFFFALAVAVGLTPEMLPMIVTVCLSQGRDAHGAQEGHRQAAPLHPEPRRDERALHRQDRDPHRRPRRAREALRRRSSRRTTRCWCSPTSTATSRPGSRTSSTAPSSRTPRSTSSSASPSTARSTRSRSTSAAA